MTNVSKKNNKYSDRIKAFQGSQKGQKAGSQVIMSLLKEKKFGKSAPFYDGSKLYFAWLITILSTLFKYRIPQES